MEKKICKNCGIEKTENQYYLSRFIGQNRMEICKDCFIDEIKNNGNLLDVFKEYEIPYLCDLWSELENNFTGLELINRYMRDISSLPQYKNMTWKDSKIYKEENEIEVNFYDEIIKNLKEEAKKLNKKLTTINNNNGDYNTYIAVLKSLRETLELIHKYDWHLDYSEYEVLDDNDNKIKQISIWEQNFDNQIRNHRIWNVV